VVETGDKLKLQPPDPPRLLAASGGGRILVKGKLFLIHWNDDEALEKAAQWRARGWDVDLEAEDGARAAKAIVESPPHVILIYLDRLPSHGRETAHYIHSGKSTGQIPIVFCGGHGAALEKVKAKVSEAVFATEADLEEVVEGFAQGGA
jgi:CheY-like chemotaxis protein